MKKIGISALTALLLASCSLTELFPGPTVVSTFATAAQATSSRTSTPIPTRPTSTFTSTPTLIGFKTPTLEATPGTEITIPVSTNTATVVIPSQVIDGFTFVRLSSTEFYIGGCEPSQVIFTVQVARPNEAALVELFVRLKSTTTGATSEWTNLGMVNLGAGTFSHTLVADQIKALRSYKDPWVQYQLVATAGPGKEIGRTQIFDEALRLKSCPTPTSTP